MSLQLSVVERCTFAGGHRFGESGAYERLKLRVQYEVDPRDRANEAIDDLELAPTDRDGKIRFAGDVFMLKPVDLARWNRRLLCDLPNRGNMRALQFFNDAAASNNPTSHDHAGNGFLMRRGYAVVTPAWQGDVLPGDDRLVLQLPIARSPSGPVTGTVHAEFVVDRPDVFTLPLSGRVATRSHPSTTLDSREATLTRRRYPGSERLAIPHTQWSFARTEGGGRPGRVEGDGSGNEMAVIPSHGHLYLHSGFEAGWIYELVYTARDPLVLGLGYAAVRDIVSFLRHDRSAGNPLCSADARVEKAYAWGRSQAGRFVRDFLYRGFNADTRGARVFEGAMSHIAGAGRTTPHRFSNLVIAASRQYEDHDHAADSFPFSYAWTDDHFTGARDAILKRPDTDPLVIHSQTASEYWQRRGSLVHTDTRGNDLEQPESVRIYAWASSQHWADPRLQAATRGVCQNLINVVSTSMLFRAQLDLLERWASDGVAPPASRHPRCSDGSLVPFETWRTQFPSIPGVALPRSPNELPLGGGDTGRDRRNDATVGGDRYPVLVPAVDPDGNDVGGIRVPMVAAPLGTYTGWNLRSRGYGQGSMHDFSGSYIPFADAVEEAQASGDPRAAVLARYPDATAYVEAIRREAKQLIAQRLLLAEDLEGIVAAAGDWGRPRHETRLPAAGEPIEQTGRLAAPETDITVDVGFAHG